MTHLWEVYHPYYGSDAVNEHLESFAELREAVDGLSSHLNHVYRWDWTLPDDDGERGEIFQVFTVIARKHSLSSLSCPISREEEADVLEWLRSPRVLGALRLLWEPLLNTDEVAS